MNEKAEIIVKTLKEMGYRVVTLEDKSCMAYPAINISIVPERWAQANYPGQKNSPDGDA
jgi:predicted GTPase